METKVMSANLARIAYLLAHQLPTRICFVSGVLDTTGIDMNSLELGEKAALETFLQVKHPVKQLLTDRNDPPIENDWWG